jgi:hypothetical protein
LVPVFSRARRIVRRERSLSSARENVRAQLAASRAYSELIARGFSGAPGPQQIADAEAHFGSVLDGQLEGVRDEDWAQAFRSTLSVYTQVTGTSPSGVPTASYGLVQLPIAQSQLQAASGAILSTRNDTATGLDASLVSSDQHAQTLPAAAASMCFEAAFPLNQSPIPTIRQNNIQRMSQGAYALGAHLNSLLAPLTAVQGGAAAELSSLVSHARAEMKSWVGIEEVELTRKSAGRRKVRTRLPIEEAQGLQDGSNGVSLELVVAGSPTDAECRAGTRSLCPSALPGTPWVLDNATKIAGTADGFVTFEAEYTGSVTEVGFQVKATQHFYVILKKQGRSGRVLAAFRPENTPQNIYYGSAHQRAQIEKAFAPTRRSGRPDACVAGASSGLSDAYCAGMPRNAYVPIANELTGSGSASDDSWKHYLQLARHAATQADQLGREMINAGLQLDFRREAAQEAIGSVCGSYALPDVTYSADGTLTNPGDGELAQCIAPTSVDVLFLANRTDIESAAQVVYEDYCVGPPAVSSDLCSALAPPVPPSTTPPAGLAEFSPTASGKTFATLGLVPAMPLEGGVELEGTPGCQGITQKAGTPAPQVVDEYLRETSFFPSTDTAFALRNFVASDSVSPAGLANALSKLRFDETSNGHWTLQINGTVILAGRTSSAEGAPVALTHYPLCEQVGQPCSAEALNIKESLGISAPMSQELANRLRRLVEGGIAHLAVLSGYLPPNVISLHVPVADFGTGPGYAPVTTIYGKGLFDPTPYGQRLRVPDGTTFEEDRETLGDVEPMTTEIKEYRSSIYERAGTADGTNSLSVLDRIPYGTPFGIPLETPDGTYTPGPNIWLMRRTINRAQAFPRISDGTLYENARGWMEYALGLEPKLAQYANPRERFLRTMQTGLRAKGKDLFFEGSFYSGIALSAVQGWKGVNGPTLGDLVPDTNGASAGDAAYAFNWFQQPEADVTYGGDPFYELAAGACTGFPNKSGLILSSGCATTDWAPTVTSPGQACTGSGCEATERLWRNGLSGYTRTLLSPTVWPPEGRAHLFLDPGVDSVQGILGMAMLTCMGSEESAAGGTFPVVYSPDQIGLLRSWIENRAHAVSEAQGRVFLLDVPVDVVEYVRNSDPLIASVERGEHGRQLADLAHALNEAYSGFDDIAAGFRQMNSAIEGVQIDLDQLQVNKSQALSQIALSRINAAGTLAKGVLQASTGWLAGLGGVASSAAGIIDVQTSEKALGELRNSEALSEDSYGIGVGGVLKAMGDQVVQGYELATHGVTRVSDAQLSALSALNSLSSSGKAASFALAKGTGAGYADLNGDGTPDVELPVNQVLRRDYNITRVRYMRALESAKRYAYMARLSIEQRLGIRMDAISEPLGEIGAPRDWVEDVCGMQGVNYETLREGASQGTGGSSGESDESAFIADFADGYIGDYVDRLEGFLEHYNTLFPFHEEDDAVVLSVRDDLVYGDALCLVPSDNLLFHSGDLSRGPSLSDNDPAVSAGGWRRTDCSAESECIADVRAGTYLLDPEGAGNGIPTPLYSPTGQGPTLGQLANGVSILTRMGGEPPTSPPLAPPVSVYQSVYLNAGSNLLLSFWDMARTGTGGPVSADASAPFTVTVSSADWRHVDQKSFFAPAKAGSDTAWSTREVFAFSTTTEGYYHISFSLPAGQLGLALANIQLEAAQSSEPRDYQPTTDLRERVSSACGPGLPEAFRENFVRACLGPNNCYYELLKPIYLSEGSIADGSSPLDGLAENNYNYRHTGLALNVVGTGVLDCNGQGASCFANGFLEYDLFHSALRAEIVDYADEARCFNFGSAAVRHGKALVTERYLGIPLSSNDREQIEQDSFLSTTLAGRPLSGTYRLRIYENDALRWENVEDIQLLLKHRYWSRVDTGN